LVDSADFDIWFGHLQVHTSQWTLGDLNNDGIVDSADFDIWFSHLQQSLPADEPVQVQAPAVTPALTLTTASPTLAIAAATPSSSPLTPQDSQLSPVLTSARFTLSSPILDSHKSPALWTHVPHAWKGHRTIVSLDSNSSLLSLNGNLES